MSRWMGLERFQLDGQSDGGLQKLRCSALWRGACEAWGRRRAVRTLLLLARAEAYISDDYEARSRLF